MVSEVFYNPQSYEKLAQLESDHWWFRVRNSLLLWVLREKVSKFKNLLEVGCGTGFVLEGIHKEFPDAVLMGAEIFEEGLAFARDRVASATFQQLDVRNFDEKDVYDVIGAFDVIEHINEDEKVLLNLSNALRRGGSLLLTVPQHRWLWSSADEHACHVRRYSRKELLKKVTNSNLKLIYVTSFVSVLLPLMWLVRFRDRKSEYDPMSEFLIPKRLNQTLEFIMKMEQKLIKWGVTFPFGGSLLLLAKKPQ